MFFTKNNFKKRFNYSIVLTFLLILSLGKFSYCEDEYLIPMGNIIQIDAELNEVVVRNEVEDSPFVVGDRFLSVNNIKIENYGEFLNSIYDLNNSEKINIELIRGEEILNIKTSKYELEKLNLNSSLSGFATLTYINPNNNNFAAVGHPIGIGCCKNIPIKNGYIFSTNNPTVKKSSKGNVGFLSAKRSDAIGKFSTNDSFGIKGNIVTLDTSSLKKYKIASLDEVKTGKAQLVLQTKNSQVEKFDIEILAVNKQNSPEPKTFKIKITDKRLLNLTGGIVQGMSGAPIIQDDKIIGAVSHAIENNPQTGYAVFIRWMLN